MAAHNFEYECLGVEAEEVEEEGKEEQDDDVEGEVDATVEEVKAEDNKVAHQQSHYHHRETPCHQLQGLKNRVNAPNGFGALLCDAFRSCKTPSFHFPLHRHIYCC